MCKYCDYIEDKEGIETFCFERKKGFLRKSKTEKILGAIINTKEEVHNCAMIQNPDYPVISFQKKKKDLQWYDLPINYCPMCGKKLRN